jgi:O-antigen ligase
LTGSRGAAVGLLLGLIVYGFLDRNRKGIGFITLIFLFIIVTMFAYPYLLPSEVSASCSTSVTHGVEDSANGRELIWLSSLNMFKLKPITGWGLIGTYFADSSIYLYHKREFHSHNIWLTVISSLGVVGLAIYVYMRYNLYKELKMLWNSGCKLVPLLISVQALILGHGLVDFTAMTPHGGFIFFGASALVYSLAIQYNSSSTQYYYSIYSLLSKHKVRGAFESPHKF